MPIYQINLWVCEVCGDTFSTTAADISMYDDPVVIPPDAIPDPIHGTVTKWGFTAADELTCPKCMARKEEP
jgi:rubrerythrin